MKKVRPAKAGLTGSYALKQKLQLGHVGSLELAILPSGNLEGDLIAFIEGLETVHLNLREVNEQIVAILARDEAIALIGIKPLNSTFSHLKRLSICP